MIGLFYPYFFVLPVPPLKYQMIFGSATTRIAYNILNLFSFQVKKHIKQGQGHEGGIFTVEAPLHVSNVQIVDPVTGKPCKVGIRYLEDGSKVRVSRGIGASGSIIPRPEILKERTTPRPTVVGPKDTVMDLVLEETYNGKTGKGMPDL
ncbi:hypothetical protein AgCh_032870 [Apium graveolens]